MRDASSHCSHSQCGFSLIEVMTAAVISVIAVVGLAYSFSTGRGLIDRYATARAALGVAERRLETLAMESSKDPTMPDLAVGVHGPFPRTLDQNPSGSESWTVAWVDDPVDNPGGDANPNDYKRITVEVSWTQGGLQDRVRLARTFLGP
jgi:prepilin-type N-terminal cleavage/methylation domain-containing protein